MPAVVEMYRDAVEVKGRDRFSCSLATWALLAELGQAFGWRPQGTTYRVPPRMKVETPALQDYQPGNSLDHKLIQREDAVAWATALGIAKSSPHAAAMIRARAVVNTEETKAADELPMALLDEFIEFAYGGAFMFAVADSDKRRRSAAS